MKMNRLERVIKGMQAMGLEQIIVSEPASVYYLTGLWVHPGERMLALYVTEKGAVLYANRLFALSGSADLPLVEYDDTDDCVAVLAENILPGKLGIDKFWPSQFTIRLMEARGDVKCVLGSKCVDDARMLKDAEELDLMRISSLKNDEAISRAIAAIRAGMTERELAAEYAKASEALGSGGASFDALICFGANCAEPHHDTDNSVLQHGDSVILDVGLTWKSYCSDMTRTVFFGEATDEQKRVYDLVEKANRAGRAAVKPGVPLSVVDRAARKVIEDAGYGKYFIHRTGHGIGLETHEPPDVSATSNIIAQPGMVFSVEPGIYLPGNFGVRVEDLVAVTEDGCETLNKLEKGLVIVK